MPESGYSALVRQAAATWPLIVRVLRRRHPNAARAVVEDCAIEAIELFSDPKNFEKILHPEQPLPWLGKTAEHLYHHELRKMGRFLHF